jgi:hypothetical protein
MKKRLVVLSLFITGIISGQIVTIPDANFKAALLPIADTNNDGEIQVSEAEALQIMDVQSQNIASMEGIQSFVNLTSLNCSSNSLTQLYVTQNQSLEELFISFNSLNAIDISQNPNLNWLSCSYNEMSTLDLSLSPNLFYLNCRYNLLTELDLTNNPAINTINVEYNLITDLDLSENPMLDSLWFNDNQLVSLNVQNGNNAALSLLFTFNNPNLDCIQVDDPIAANNYPSWAKDSTAVYSVDCALGFDDSEIVQAVIYPNPVQDILTIESKEYIISTEVYSMLGVLLASEKGKSQVDFSTYGKGIYFLKIDTEKGAAFQKVLKE